MARIINYPDNHTSAYAELWSADKFIAAAWWGAALPSEEKGDVWNVGASHKVDLPAPCFVAWEGTLPNGTRTVQLVSVGSVDKLENPPGASFLPVYPGVNVIEFTDAPAPPPPDEPAPEPPDEPQPEPEPEEPTPPVPTQPRVITIYGGGIGNTNRPVVERRGDEFVASVPRAWFDALWELVVSRIGEWFERG